MSNLFKFQLIFCVIGALGLIILSCDEPEESIPQPNPAPPIVEPETPKTYQLVWSDEFEGDAIDTTKWAFQIGDGSAEGIPGWGNNELEYYTDRPENAFIEGGNLVIEARQENLKELPILQHG